MDEVIVFEVANSNPCEGVVDLEAQIETQQFLTEIAEY
jgi:hypothetical protein